MVEKASVLAHMLEYFRDEFKSIAPLIGNVAPRTSIYRWKKRLVENGWLETDGKDRYKTTTAGILELEKLRGATPVGLSNLYPPLEGVPTPQHRAFIELGFAAVTARKYQLRQDRHPTLILAGPTLTWKTSCAAFLCHMVGLDPLRQVTNLAAESGKSLWLRKTSTGQITYKRELLDTELMVFDEFQAADTETRRLLSIFIDGRKTISFENQELTIHPVPLLIINPTQDSTLEGRLRLTAPQIRRSLICDLTKMKVPDLALKGERIVQTAKAYGSLALKKPKGDCTEYKADVYSLFKACLSPQGLQLVDFEMLLMLSSAMTAYLEPLEAIRLVFYDSFLLCETLDWTQPGWGLHLKSFPATVASNAPTIESSGGRMVPDEIWIKAFEYLDAGGATTELVTKLHLNIEVAERIAKKHSEIEALTEKASKQTGAVDDPVVLRAEKDLKLAELRRRKTELEKPLELERSLGNLNATFGASGGWKREHCAHLEANYCLHWHWNEKPAVIYQVGEPLEKDGKWHIRPTYARCAVCSNYLERGTSSLLSLELRLRDLETELQETPISGLRRKFKCSYCGSKKLVAAKITCTKCGYETWWGYHPR